MLEMPELWETCRELPKDSGNSQREQSVLQSTKLKELKSASTSDMETQSLEFAQLVFSLPLVQRFLTYIFPF